jgi:hypothetical protein
MGLYDIFLRTGACVWMVAELLLASAIRLPACSPGASLAFCATQVGVRWAMWSTLGERMGSWRSRLGIRTPAYAPYAARGGRLIGSSTLRTESGGSYIGTSGEGGAFYA